jgi:hypothetical protein
MENLDWGRVVWLTMWPCIISSTDWMESTQCPQINFPDGVYHLLCGQNANKRISQLQYELLANLVLEADLAGIREYEN